MCVCVLFYSWLQKLAREIGHAYEETNSTGKRVWAGGPSSGMAYASALYYTLSCMTSVGFGNVNSVTEMEKIFTICMMILGCKLPWKHVWLYWGISYHGNMYGDTRV